MKRTGFIPLFTIAVILTYSSVFPISVSVRSSKDYSLTTKIIRELKPMMTNFKTDENKKNMDLLLKNFEEAALDYYGNNYDSSAIKFFNLKLELIKTLQNMSKFYIDRTDELLKATAADNKTIEAFITYSKHSGYASYYNRPFDPLTDVKPYDENFTIQDFHLFTDAQKVDNYLRNAHFYFSEAKRFYNDPEIVFIKSRKRIKSDQLSYILERYIYVIQNCRIAKQCGLEIYKIKNEFRTGAMQDKYQLRKSMITPIFDDRIPEKFKVDAVDNIKLLYPVELERRKKVLAQTK
jgi:hypothetical protein